MTTTETHNKNKNKNNTPSDIYVASAEVLYLYSCVTHVSFMYSWCCWWCCLIIVFYFFIFAAFGFCRFLTVLSLFFLLLLLLHLFSCVWKKQHFLKFKTNIYASIWSVSINNCNVMVLWCARSHDFRYVLAVVFVSCSSFALNCQTHLNCFAASSSFFLLLLFVTLSHFLAI